MKFVYEGTEAAGKAAAKQIVTAVKEKQPVVWLVCGGSNIPIEVEIMGQVREAVPEGLGNLLILPMDERYGEPGHADSNYRQLHDAGFDPGNALWVDILGQNLPLQETIGYYTNLVRAAFDSAKTIIGLFGLGTDGHTAGVLPGSPAVTNTVASVVGYDSPPFVRLTLTPTELVKTSQAFVLAYGDSKFKPLTRLRKNGEPIEKLPSRLLYDIEHTYVYNDQLEDE